MLLVTRSRFDVVKTLEVSEVFPSFSWHVYVDCASNSLRELFYCIHFSCCFFSLFSGCSIFSLVVVVVVHAVPFCSMLNVEFVTDLLIQQHRKTLCASLHFVFSFSFIFSFHKWEIRCTIGQHFFPLIYFYNVNTFR